MEKTINTAAITGAGSGLGLDLAIGFAKSKDPIGFYY